MAVRGAVQHQPGPNVVTITWSGLVNGDTGAPVQTLDFADACVQFGGTFDTSTILFEGSNDGVTYATLTDAQGTAISKTAAALEQIIEAPLYLRPRCSAGGGSTSLTVILYARQGR